MTLLTIQDPNVIEQLPYFLDQEQVGSDIGLLALKAVHCAKLRLSKRVPTMTVMVSEDRSMCVQPHQVVRTAWVDIDLCRLNFRLPMSPEAVEKKYRRLLNLGQCAPWAPVVGHWEDGRFVVCDGRHDYLAALMIGRDRLFVCWLETAPEAIPDLRQPDANTCPTQRDSSVAQVTSELAEQLSD